LNEEVKAWFHIAQREKYRTVGYSQCEEKNAGQGHIEVRNCLQLEIRQDWLSGKEKWSTIKTAVRVYSQRHIGDKCTTESRYYISSLQLNAERLNHIVSNHWSLENTLHRTLDIMFREDYSRIRRGNAAEVMNAFRKVALNIVKTNTTRKQSWNGS
jgi:predicted transposase YbfD/YdcC